MLLPPLLSLHRQRTLDEYLLGNSDLSGDPAAHENYRKKHARATIEQMT
jgi:hypothetical protein